MLIIVNLDPVNMQHGHVRLPLADWGVPPAADLAVHDLLSDEHYYWRGEWNYVRLDPATRVRPHPGRSACPPSPADADPLWYKDAIIYELHVKAFFDSNDDGIGDFPGLIQKLDYLQDLGITCLWLLPFYPSPLRDDGYDIADYHGVHPELRHAQGLRASSARRTGAASGSSPSWSSTTPPTSTPGSRPRGTRRPGSPKRDFYVWSDTDREVPGRPDHLHRHRDLELDVGPGRQGSTTGTASSTTSPT